MWQAPKKRLPHYLSASVNDWGIQIVCKEIYSDSSQVIDWVGHMLIAESISASVLPVGLVTVAVAPVIANVLLQKLVQVPHPIHDSCFTLGCFIITPYAMSIPFHYDGDMKSIERIVVFVVLTLVWVGGGLSWQSSATVIAGTVVSLGWLFFAYYKKRTLLFPRYFFWTCLLVLVSLLSVWWSKGYLKTLENVVLMASGIMWWVGSITLASVKGFSKTVRQSVLIAGVILTCLWAAKTVFNWPSSFDYGYSSLVVEASTNLNHNHLGDWWMVMLILGESWSEMSFWLLPGMVMIWMMRSRSALVGLIGGWGYISWVFDWFNRYKRQTIVAGLFLMILFLGLGLGKGTLASRDYYIQTVAGLTKYPFGVGLANFDVISLDPANHWWGRSDFSSIVHNVLLEWIAGMGWLGFVGWIWVGLQSWHMGLRTTSNKVIWRAAYWAILINFLLDTTYFIPSMWWLWFVVMGLGEGEE